MKRIAAIAAGLAMLVAGNARADSPRRYLDTGNRLYSEGKLEQALAAYREGLLHFPAVPELHHGTGNVLYRMKKFPEAAKEYEEAARAGTQDLRGAARYNHGDAQVRQGQLGEALESYKQALREHPEDADAKFNYELIKGRLDEMKNKNPKNQDKNSDNKKQPDSQQKQPSKPGEDKKPQGQDQQEPKQGKAMKDPQQLTKQQAEEILKALSSDEQRLQRERLKARVTQRHPEKDW